MKRKNITIKLVKTFIVVIFSFILCLEGVNAGGGTASSGDDGGSYGICKDCSWLYHARGVRLSLYKYNGKGNPVQLGSSIEAIDPIGWAHYDANGKFIRWWEYDERFNNVNGKKAYFTLSTTGARGRLNYNYNGQKFLWESTARGGRMVSFQSLGLHCLYGEARRDEFLCSEKNFRQSVKDIFKLETDVTTAIQTVGLKFGVSLENKEVQNYYIVIEPTAMIYDTGSLKFYYGTSYELLRLRQTNEGVLKGLDPLVMTDWPNNLRATLNQETCDKNSFVCNNGKQKITAVADNRVDNVGNDMLRNANSGYGISVYWLFADLKSCDNVCTDSTGNKLKGDALLKCAENYCSNFDPEVTNSTTKRTCITSNNKCGYKAPTLSCGDQNQTKPKDGVCDMVTTSSADTCVLWNKDSYDGVPYQFMRKCTTTNNVTFPSTLPAVLNPGKGLDYQIIKSGSRTCTTTFDYNKWKLDYAASYSDAERKKQLAVLDHFEKKDYTGSLYKYESDVIDEDLSEIEFTERVNGEVKKTTRKIELLERNIHGTTPTVGVEKKSTITVKSYHNNVETSKKMSIFMTNSNNESLFGLDMKCLSNEDSGVIYDPVKQVLGGRTVYKCKNGDVETRAYYSSFKANLGKNTTRAVVAMPTKNADGSVFEHLDKCEYEITDTDEPDVSCDILDAREDSVAYDNAKINDGLYEYYTGRRPTFYLKIHNKKYAQAWGLNANSKKYNGETKLTYSINRNSDGTKGVTIYGVVKDKKGREATCDKTIRWKCPTCDNCIIYKNTNTFDLKSESNVYFYGMRYGYDVKTEQQLLKKCDLERSRYPSGMALKDKEKKYYTCLGYGNVHSLPYDKNKTTIVMGVMVFSNGMVKTCNDSHRPPGKTKNCESTYERGKASKLLEIADYCEKNWKDDVNGYSSVNDCFEKCGDPCPIFNESYENNVNYCTSYWKHNGFHDVNSCINFCTPGNGGFDYYYRPINNNSPFPGNNFILSNGKTGRRPGSNWLAFDGYITQDRNDRTSVQSKNPEYVINLTGENIKEIRKQTAQWNSSNKGNNVYIYYVRASNNKDGEYKSKFIHDDNISAGGFNKYFTVVDGRPN